MKERVSTYLSKNYEPLIKNGHLYQLIKKQKLTKNIHNHDFFELVIVIHGEVFHNINDKTQKMQECDFTFLSPKDIHFFEGQSVDTYIFSLSIISEKFTRILSALEFTPSFGTIYKTKNKKLLKELTRIPMAHPTRQKLLINSVILDLLIEALKTNPPFNDAIPHPLQLAIDKIRSPENINGGVAKFAELAGYSKMHLGRLIKQYYGKTPSALLHDIRMKLATEYLEKTSFTIEKIAEDVGFSSVSQFYAAFKKQYQCTPHTYRKKIQTSSLFLS